MKRVFAAIGLSITCLSMATVARAGIFSDDLGRCLVSSSSQEDRAKLVIWIYGAMSVHPDIKKYSSMTDEQRLANNKAASDLFVRLLTVDCRTQTLAALKNEGAVSMESAFEMLGRVAMNQLIQNSSVSQSMGSFSKGVAGNERFMSLLKEAGMGN